MIKRRTFIGGALAASAFGSTVRAKTPASSLYDRAIVIDALGGYGRFDPGQAGSPIDQGSFADVRASGVTAINLTVSAVGNRPDSFETTVAQISRAERDLAAHPDVFLHVRKAADLKVAKASGRCGVIYGFQDSTPLGPKLEQLDIFDDLGLRICQPTYNVRNWAGDGSIEAANGGLSKLGFDLVAALNDRRILVDLSHAGVRVIDEGIAASTRPPAITHSGCRALRDHPRNTSDAAMRALAAKGGVIGIYFMPYLTATPGGPPSGADVIRHIEHAWQVAGEDHVGIGTDGSISPVALTPAYRKWFAEMQAGRTASGIAAPGEGAETFLFAAEYNTPRRLETLASDLLARGHSTARVEKLIGGNFARLFADVWG